MNSERLTTDTPKGNFERLMNYAYTKNGRAFLSYAGGKYDIDLCEYVSALSKDKNYNYSPEFIFEDGLLDDYDNDFAILYYCAIQAAQLREALKMYEDKLENRTLIELPCKVGDIVYVIPSLTNFRLNVLHGYSDANRVYEQEVHSIQMWKSDEWCLWTCGRINLLLQGDYKKTWFLSKEEAEQKLKELKK